MAMRVLLVDDEVRLAETVARGLRAEGFEVDLAHTGPDGLWRAREGSYAAIVLDIEENRGPLAHLTDARSLERRNVNEDVLRAAFGRDEAIALGGVEELDGALLLRHERYPFPLAACQ